jgi:predicted acyl esterase
MSAEPPISLDDFAAGPGDVVAPRSAGFDPDRPFLTEGLEPRYATRTVRSGFIPMRDGTRLSCDFHIPVGAPLPLPVILTRTPYNKRGVWPPLQSIYPEQGFVYCIQDVRGRYESEGAFIACTGQDRDDAADTVSWLAAQPWCNGAVGATGTSYTGETSAKLAATCHPSHRASIIMYDGAYAGGCVQNGAFLQYGMSMLRGLFMWFRDYVPKYSLGPPEGWDRQDWFRSPFSQTYATQPVNQPPVDMEAQLRTLPVFDMLDRSGAAPSEFTDMMRRSADPGDRYWRDHGFLSDKDRIDTPTLHLTGPTEQGGSGAQLFQLFRRIAVSARARDNQKLLFTPAPHSMHHQATADYAIGQRRFGDTRFAYYRTFIDWWGHWLRGEVNDVESWPAVRAFMAGRNAWEDMDDFPPSDVGEVKLHLGADGGLGLAAPEPGHVGYRYDPGDPTPSEPGGADTPLVGVGYADRSGLETRPDLIAFTSAPLTAPLKLAGAVSVRLYVSSSAKDTDFVAVLLEVDGEGRALNITHGVSRMRWRDGFDAPLWMTPKEIYPVTIDLWFAAIEVAAGKRLRLHVASAYFPAFDRNLNTGGDNFTETAFVAADNEVHCGGQHGSYVALPARGGTIAL